MTSGEPNIYYPIRKSPRRLVLTCQRCHGETNWLQEVLRALPNSY